MVTFFSVLLTVRKKKKLRCRETFPFRARCQVTKITNFAFKSSFQRNDMKKKEATGTIIEICPVRNVIARFGNKWALLTVLIIGEQQVVRFNELNRLIPDVSSRVLSSTLRTLEADGFVSRKIYPVVPPKVEYRLTETGESLLPLIRQLTEWAHTNMKKVMDHRRKYEAGEA